MSIHFEWAQDMSVGEATIDAQHQKLLKQVNAVIDAMAFGATSTQVTDALGFFEQYIDEHLSYEEQYMQERNFGDFDHHVALHQSFRDKYADFKAKLASGQTPNDVLIDIEEFLGGWWVDHIGHEDHKYFLALGASNQ
jgi:hemerythrin-like metal-binding protein